MFKFLPCLCFLLGMFHPCSNGQEPSDIFAESDIITEAQRSHMILGLSLEELKEIWGSTNIGNPGEVNLGRGWSKNDKDQYLFYGDWPILWKWKKDDCEVIAYFRNNRCCALEVSGMKQPSLAKALELARKWMPVELESSSWSENENFSLYSMTPQDYYQFQFWGGDSPPRFYLKAPGLLKEMYTKTDVCVEDDHGVLCLPVENAVRERLQISGTPQTGFSTRVWHAKEAALSWDINVAESRNYIVELTWSREYPLGNAVLELDVMGKTELTWPIENTGGFHDSGKILSRKIGLCELPSGQSTVKLHIPNLQEGSRGMDVVSLRFIPESGYEEKVAQLKKMPRLGMYLHDLELLWGKSRPGRKIPIDLPAGPGDVDYDIYRGMINDLEWRQWYVAGLRINAVMYKNECIALQFEIPGIKANEALDIVNSLVPGTPFAALASMGKAPLTVYTPDKSLKFQYRGNRFEVKSSKLVKILRGKELAEMAQLANRPLLGLSLEEIKLLLGEGQERIHLIALDRRGDENDVDWQLYRGMNTQVDTWQWNFPDREGMQITAMFLHGKCISLDIHRTRGFTIQDALNTAEEFAPGIRFAIEPSNRRTQFTTYSVNFNKGYKLQSWLDYNYIEIKASGLIRQLKAEHSSQLKEGGRKLIERLAKNSGSKKSPLPGQSREALEKVLGTSEKTVGRYDLKAYQWSFPHTTIALFGSFMNDGEKEQCLDMTIFDKGKSLDPQYAFAIARQIVSPLLVKIPVIEDPGKNFSITSQDEAKRFELIWEDDIKYGKVLRIKDNSLVDRKTPVKPSGSGSALDQLKDLL